MHVGAVYWENTPNRRTRTFKATFLPDNTGVATFSPGACLQNATGSKYCCKYETVQVSGLWTARHVSCCVTVTWPFQLKLVTHARTHTHPNAKIHTHAQVLVVDP